MDVYETWAAGSKPHVTCAGRLVGETPLTKPSHMPVRPAEGGRS